MNCFYDNVGRLLRAIGPEGQVYGAGYDYPSGQDQPYVVTNAEGIIVTNNYSGRLLTERDYPNGMAEHFNWSYQAKLGSVQDAAGRQTTYIYDPAGRVLYVTNAAGQAGQFAYGRAGELLSLTNENGAVTRWAYDIYGRAIAKTNANGLCLETNGFDANGRLTAHWTPAKGRTTYDYDNNGNLTSIHYPNSTITYGYVALNRVVAVGDAVGGETFSYQNFGAFSSALATEVGPWGESVSRGYQQGLLRSLSLGGWGQSYFYDNAQRLSTIGSPAGAFNYSYNGAGSQIAGLSLPGGSTIGYAYDPAGLLTSTALTNGLGQLLDSAAYTYDLSGLRTNVLRDSGVNVAYAYDPAGQLTGAVGHEPSGALRHNENFAYEYDPAGNLTNRINDCLSQAFRTDPANQLTNISRLVSLITEAGSLTNLPFGLSVSGTNAVISASDLTFAATNIVLLDGLNYFTNILKTNSALSAWFTNVLVKNLPATVTPSYDLNGNMVSDGPHGYTYDAANQLVIITVTNVSQSVFVYDGLGRRRIRQEFVWVSALGNWQLTNEVRYVYDGMLAIQERDSNNVARVSYTLGTDLSGGLQGAGGIGGLLARTDGSGSAYYHADGAESITALVNAQGDLVAKYLYDPFGNTLGKWGPLADANLYRFSSKEVHGPSGLYYYGFRFYDPNLQRWPNVDPIQEAGGVNSHGFVDNDPVNGMDWYGLSVQFPSGPPPVPVPGDPQAKWVQKGFQGNRPAWRSDRPIVGRSPPIASYDRTGSVGHWDIDDGLGNAEWVDIRGRRIPPGNQHTLDYRRPKSGPGSKSTTVGAGLILAGTIGTVEAMDQMAGDAFPRMVAAARRGDQDLVDTLLDDAALEAACKGGGSMTWGGVVSSYEVSKLLAGKKEDAGWAVTPGRAWVGQLGVATGPTNDLALWQLTYEYVRDFWQRLIEPFKAMWRP